jgi:hypothetical protein
MESMPEMGCEKTADALSAISQAGPLFALGIFPDE